MRTAAIAMAIMLAVGLGGGTVASAAHAEATAGTEAGKSDKSKKICRTIVTSGTRFSTRHCRSKEDWDKDAEASRRYLEESQTTGYHKDGEQSGAGIIGGAGPPR